MLTTFSVLKELKEVPNVNSLRELRLYNLNSRYLLKIDYASKGNGCTGLY